MLGNNRKNRFRGRRAALVAAFSAAILALASAPADAAAAPTAGAFCPERAPVLGTYRYSFVGSNGHHYDVYRGLPFSPFGHAIVDCDA